MTQNIMSPSINIALVQARESVLSYFRPVFNEVGITEQQWRIIRLLAESNTLDFQDLSDQACILRPSLTGVLTRLEKCGLVLRLKPAKDQRRVFLKLTAAGRQLYTQASHRIDACQQQLAHDFSPKKLNQLHELLQELNTLAKHKSEQAEKFKP